MKATAPLRAALLELVEAAIGGDVLAGADFGFVGVMARAAPAIRQDIAPAFEMYTLLAHYLAALPLATGALDGVEVALAPAIHYDQAGGRVLALLPVGKNELALVAHWLAGGLRSDAVKAMPGVLALPFSIETHAGRRHVLPEWFAAYYVDGRPQHCVPLLALASMAHERGLADWMAVAFERMALFGLPCAEARAAVAAAGR